MTFQPGANLYTQGFGSRPENVEVPHYDARAPSTTDVLYPIGKEWIWIGTGIWKLLKLSTISGVTSATWVEIANSSGAILSITGTANQITATNVAGNVTLSIPTTFIAPGSIASTTTLTGGTGITATTGNITATAGNIVATAGSVTAGTTVNAGTGITSTTGNITATNGNLVLSTAGNKLLIAAGANASVGVTDAMTGSPGASVTVTNSSVTASSIILYSRATGGGALSEVSITAQTTGSFTLTSTGAETSTFNYLIIN